MLETWERLWLVNGNILHCLVAMFTLSRGSLDLSSYYTVPCFSNHSSGCKTRMSTSAAVCENSQCGLFGTAAPMEYSFDFRVSLADHTDSIHGVRLSDQPAESFLNCSVRVICGCSLYVCLQVDHSYMH